jgi:hypothetical protein
MLIRTGDRRRPHRGCGLGVEKQPASINGESAMADQPTELDTHRGMAAQKATELRRLRMEVEKDHSELLARREELEKYLAAASSETWGEAVEKTRYLLSLFAETPACQDPRRKLLIKSLLADFERLLHAGTGDRGKPT